MAWLLRFVVVRLNIFLRGVIYTSKYLMIWRKIKIKISFNNIWRHRVYARVNTTTPHIFDNLLLRIELGINGYLKTVIGVKRFFLDSVKVEFILIVVNTPDRRYVQEILIALIC